MKSNPVEFAKQQIYLKYMFVKELNKKVDEASQEFDRLVKETQDLIQKSKQLRGEAQNKRDNLKRYLKEQEEVLIKMKVHKRLLESQHKFIDNQKDVK